MLDKNKILASEASNNRVVTFRLSKDVWDMIKHRSNKQCISPSDWLRHAIREKIKQG